MCHDLRTLPTCKNIGAQTAGVCMWFCKTLPLPSNSLYFAFDECRLQFSARVVHPFGLCIVNPESTKHSPHDPQTKLGQVSNQPLIDVRRVNAEGFRYFVKGKALIWAAAACYLIVQPVGWECWDKKDLRHSQ